MRVVKAVLQRLASRFTPALAGGPFAICQPASDPGTEEAQRKSIHDVTLEQLGIAHWSFHTLF